MSTQKTILPGQPGTKKWLRQYGEALVCVRYKYDPVHQKKIKTVEVIVEEQQWIKNKTRIPANRMVSLRIDYGEIEKGRLVRAAGGKWNRGSKVWELPYREAVVLGLEDRIQWE
jgi:hypothetical protein